jgi:hypothetical protein
VTAVVLTDDSRLTHRGLRWEPRWSTLQVDRPRPVQASRQSIRSRVEGNPEAAFHPMVDAVHDDAGMAPDFGLTTGRYQARSGVLYDNDRSSVDRIPRPCMKASILASDLHSRWSSLSQNDGLTELCLLPQDAQ